MPIPIEDEERRIALPEVRFGQHETVQESLAALQRLRLRYRHGLHSNAERERTARQAVIETNWRTWLRELFPHMIRSRRTGEFTEFAQHQVKHWEWGWGLEPSIRPRPLIDLWPRGGGKSSSAEMLCTMVAARGKRRYGLYVCGTQRRADDHVSSVGSLFGTTLFASVYPEAASRSVNKITGAYGSWRHNRLQSARFTLDAIGLDTAIRGAKIEGDRPDLIILDDIDDKNDGVTAIERKIETLTGDVLATVAADAAILFAQNLIHSESIAARLADGRADFLADRIVSGPYPALYDMTAEQREVPLTDDELDELLSVEDPEFLADTLIVDRPKVRRVWFITGGRPLWEGQGVIECQNLMNDIGYRAFMREVQQNVRLPAGGMFEEVIGKIRRCSRSEVPHLARKVVALDPTGTANDDSSSAGIQVDGWDPMTQTVYRLWSWERQATPLTAVKLAIAKGAEYGAKKVIIETDFGGVDTWGVVYAHAVREVRKDVFRGEYDDNWDPFYATTIRALREKSLVWYPRYESVHTGMSPGSKLARGAQMLAAYQEDMFVHVNGTHAILDEALIRFGKVKPYDLVDAAFWAYWYLVKAPKKRGVLVQGKAKQRMIR